MQNFQYLLDISIFAHNILQSHEDDDDICMYFFMRRLIAFIRFSKEAEIQKQLKNSGQLSISHTRQS